MPFLKFILILVILYYGLKLLLKKLLPFLLTRWIRKIDSNFAETLLGTPTEQPKPAGHVTIISTPPSQVTTTVKQDVSRGEYVDFEEVESNPNERD